MKKDEKGFTLIELLAVIIILAIIALIAIPTITGIIDNSRKSAAKDSAYGFIDAFEKAALSQMLESGSDYELSDGSWSVSGSSATLGSGASQKQLTLDYKGTAPTGTGSITVSNNKVVDVNLTFNGKTCQDETANDLSTLDCE